jgi:hypothetical protein
MSDIDVGVQTFTVRDLDRTPAKVLAAADRDGVARIRQRNGQAYSIRPEPKVVKKTANWPKFARDQRTWLKQNYTGPVLTREQTTELDRLIAGDDRLL